MYGISLNHCHLVLLRESNEFPEHPGGEYEHLGALGGHYVGVGDGVRDGDVAVQADDDQMQDGGRARPDVHRQPNRAPNATKDPNAKHLD